MPDSSLLYFVDEIRAIEHAALAAHPPGTLMQRAGAASAAMAMRLRNGDAACPVLILAGPGNNGGDALEAACRLKQAGIPVCVILDADPATQPADARQALQRAVDAAVECVDMRRWRDVIDGPWSLVIDGLFGIGLTRPIEGVLAQLIAAVNLLDCPVLALDAPSGLDADTGDIAGPNGIALQATHTLTFIGNKPGLHTGHGPDHAGQVEVATLGLADDRFPPARTRLNGAALFASRLRARKRNSHKGSYGDLTVIGGARGMAGAVLLAARAGAKCGAGRVYAAFLDTPPACDSAQPELMCRSAQEHHPADGAVVIGPGLGMHAEAYDACIRTLQAELPLVLDADALNLLAAHPDLRRLLAARAAPAIITPHPLEAARLLSLGSPAIQADRLAAARALAANLHCIVILKGAGSVIAHQDGAIAVNTTGNPGLATAGTGDVLAGICGALLAQGWPAWEAALASTWLHGSAADELVQQGIGPVGLTAGELIPAVRSLFNRLIGQHVHAAP